jgi:hypothetical protein
MHALPSRRHAVKAAIVLAAALVAMPLATAAASPLAGVSDEETSIRSGDIREFHRGNGDVMFVRDRENKWYRVALNAGCLGNDWAGDKVAFRTRDVSGEINTFTEVRFLEQGRACNIDSIRRSVAPPQVDSKSPITLD